MFTVQIAIFSFLFPFNRKKDKSCSSLYNDDMSAVYSYIFSYIESEYKFRVDVILREAWLFDLVLGYLLTAILYQLPTSYVEVGMSRAKCV